MRLLVTGCSGMLGRDLLLAAELAGHEVVSLTHADVDVTDARAMRRVADRARPDAVVNCAAYTNVDGAEEEPEEALRVNAEGAHSVARAAARVGAAVVYPSSDYVFDGSKTTPYLESDEPRPLSAYGASKLAGELETGAANARHFVVRTAWLFGTGGRNFVDTMLRLAQDRRELAVVDDQIGSPTWTAHLAAAVMRLLEGRRYGVHHVAGDGETSWFGLARAIFERADPGVRVRPIKTPQLPRPAQRPEYSALATERGDGVRLPEWRVGLDGYLEERAA